MSFRKNSPWSRGFRAVTDSVSSRVSRCLRNFSRTGLSAFTLAELIVIVAILAILAATSFVALSQYAGDAREAVSKTNVRSVYSAISSESAVTGNSPRYFVVHDPSYALSGSAVIAFWTEASTLVPGAWDAPWTNYSAGNPDWTKLKLNPAKFRISAPDRRSIPILRSAFAASDPTAVLVGAADVGTADAGKPRFRSFVQAAWVLPDDSAFVVGNYPVGLSGSVAGLVKDAANSSSTWALVDGAEIWSVPGCEAVTQSGYSVPALSSGQSSDVSRTVANGTVSATASCSFWTVSVSSESVSCDSWYVPSGLSCVADVCGSTVPSHATSNAASQSVSGTWHYSATPGQCTYACASDYSWDSASSACKASCHLPVSETWSGQTYAVSAATLAHGQSLSVPASAAFGVSPANGTLSAAFSYSCGDGTLSESVTPWTASCQANYTWNSNWPSPVCSANSQTFTCSAKPATGTVWNTVSSYSQTWNGTSWAPADSVTAYGVSASSTECRYSCASGYGWSGSACLASVTGSCWSADKTYAFSASSYGSDAYCSNGTPSVSPAFPSSGSSATWTCWGQNGGANSPTCTASHSAAANCAAGNQTVNGHVYSAPSFNHSSTVSPTASVAVTNGTRTYQQTFSCSDGTVATSGAESNTANSCNSGYAWNGSSCVANSWSAGAWGACSWETGTWSYSTWGSCSLSCGSGTQSRTASCVRNSDGTQSRTAQCLRYDGVVLADANCLAAKPGTSQSCTQGTDAVCWTAGATSQACNTQSCAVAGTCWTANGTPVSSYPAANWCTSGTKTDVDTSGSDGAFNWMCNWSWGGANASCSANKTSLWVANAWKQSYLYGYGYCHFVITTTWANADCHQPWNQNSNYSYTCTSFNGSWFGLGGNAYCWLDWSDSTTWWAHYLYVSGWVLYERYYDWYEDRNDNLGALN